MAKLRKPARRKARPKAHDLALTLYQAFKSSNDVMFYCDREGTILDVNEAFTRHYGWTRKEAIGLNPRIIRSRRTDPATYKEMWSRILDPKVGFWRGELVNRTREGREIPVVLTITAVRDDKKGQIVGYISNAMNVDETRRLQERVAQAEALAQLGQMAAVVAHEIRNPLGSIVMAARQLSDAKLPDEDRDLVLKILGDESKRLNETLTNFLAYARPRPLKLDRASLNDLAAEVARVAVAPGGGKPRVETALDPSVAPFRFDADQIRQVAWNIVINGIQASEGRGGVRVSTGRRGGFAFLRVADDGPGITQGVKDELFHPFKTTKSQGTGLGLATADRIVRAHGGSIEVESAPDKGAVFTVLLPTAQV